MSTAEPASAFSSAMAFGPGGTRGPGRIGWMLSSVWLFYLIGTFAAALGNAHLVLRIIGVVVVLTFSLLYLFTFQIVRARRRAGTPSSVSLQVRVIGAGVGLTVLETVIVGEQALAMCTFVVVLALFLLSLRPALVMTVTVLALCVVLPLVIPGWKPDVGLVFGVFSASVAVFGVTTLITRNAQLAEARQELARAAVAQERSRFARDLHDLLGHSLTVVTLKAELAGRLITLDPERAEKEVAEIERLARGALVDVRAAVAGYREVSLAGELVSARIALEAAGIRAELPGALDAVPAPRRELFGWAVREGVTNVVRHSGAANCWIVIADSAIEILDDGQGPCEPESDGAAGRDGNGLLGLTERAAAVGAAVTVSRSTGGGFRLRVGW